MQRLCHKNELLQQENERLSQICVAMDENSKGNLQQKLGFDNTNLNSSQQVELYIHFSILFFFNYLKHL